MKRHLLPGLAAFALALASPSSAFAATYTVTFCADYGVDFSDADGAVVGDDYITSAADRDANGARLRVKRLRDNYDEFFTYASTTGCTTALSLDSGETYRVSIQSRAYVNGNYINVLDNDQSLTLYTYVAYDQWSPSGNGTMYFTTPVHSQWNIAAAAGWAMDRRAAGLSGENFDFLTQACSGGGSCNTGWYIYIDSMASGNPGAYEKYVIAHEMGHTVARKKNGSSSSGSNTDAAADGTCPGGTGHKMNSKEYQSGASYEGLAHYYAAVAFNNTTAGSDCKFQYYKPVDWDLDGTNEASTTTDCQNGPKAGIDEHDYLGDMCTGPLEARGTEYDWLRFFWDLDHTEGVTTTTIFDIWDDAEPDSWNTTGAGTDEVQDSTPCDVWDPTIPGYRAPKWPASRLRCAADLNSVLSAWDRQDDDNGVTR